MMFKCNSRHMTSFAEETGHHLFRSDFFHEQLSLDMALVQRPARWTVALFWAHTHSSHIIRDYLLKQRHRIFPTFLYSNRHEPFLSVYRIVRETTKTSPFAASCSCNIECMLMEEMPKDSSISRYVT